MASEAAIKAVLEADATLLAAATGGVWNWSETGRLGLSRETAAAAFDSTTGLIKPCIMVKSRGELPDGGVYANETPALSTSEIVEVWYYQDEGYSSIATMKSRVWALLHETQLTDVFLVRWAGDPIISMRDVEMGNVSVERSDYQILALKSA